jgi:hypothetical protein
MYARIVSSLVVVLAAAGAASAQAPEPLPDGWESLFNGKDLTGWELRDPKGPNGWSVRDGVLVNRPDLTKNPGSTDLQTVDKTFYDFDLHVEFRVIVLSDEEIAKAGGAPPDPHVASEISAKTGNSGVYLRGKYEVQIYDSFGAFPGWRECGSLYKRMAPRVNACRPAGEWQSYDISFRKRWLTVKQNGVEILDVNDVGPRGTGSRGIYEDGPGPILFQGDHGVVELRNIRVRRQ